MLSQRPDSTGSGIYVQAMLREAAACGHQNFLVAGIQSDWAAELDCIEKDQCRFVKFHHADVSYPIIGMSDVMPYSSGRFCDLSEKELREYETAFDRVLKKAVAAFEPDIIHSHHLWVVSSLARRLFPEIPMAATCHGSDLRQFRNCPHLRDLVLSGCRGLDAVMALSREQKEEIVRLYGFSPEAVFTVGAGYNDVLFSMGTKPAPAPVQLTYAGKLSRAKGVPWLLRALSEIDSPAWQLHLVGGGSGEEKADCLALAGQLGGRVIIHGALSQPELAAIMKQSHIFVLPSFYEGLPLVVLEGLASGCRIVATALPGIIEILGDVKTDYVQWVQMPRLRRVDQPYEQDEQRFALDLKQALLAQMEAACRYPQIDLSAVEDKMATFSWAKTFGRVQEVYYDILSG